MSGGWQAPRAAASSQQQDQYWGWGLKLGRLPVGQGGTWTHRFMLSSESAGPPPVPASLLLYMSTCCRCDDAMFPLEGSAGWFTFSGFFGVYKDPGDVLSTSFAIDVVGGRCCFGIGGFAPLLPWIFADFLDCVCRGFLLSHFSWHFSRIYFGLLFIGRNTFDVLGWHSHYLLLL